MTPKDVPDRIRDVGGTDLESRLLNAAANEVPSPELRERMAAAICMSLATPGGSAGGSSSGGGATKGTAGAGGGTGSTWIAPWIKVGVVGLVVSGAIVGVRAWRSSALHESKPSAITSTAKPAAMPELAEAPSAAAIGPSPNVVTPNPPGRGLSGTPVDLREQIAMVDAARAALAQGAGERALAFLRKYQDKYPSGSFRPEAAALKVEALAKLGRGDEARALAIRFIAEFGNGALAERVARIARLAGP